MYSISVEYVLALGYSVFLLAVAGCGLSSSRSQAKLQDQTTAKAKATTSTRREACSLVTKEEIEAALGATISEVVSDGHDCTYRPAEGSFKSAQISVDYEQAAAAMQGAKAGVKMVGLGQTVSGIGDEAVYMAPGVLYVRKGDVFMTISLFYADNPLDKTKALAEKAFARL